MSSFEAILKLYHMSGQTQSDLSANSAAAADKRGAAQKDKASAAFKKTNR